MNKVGKILKNKREKLGLSVDEVVNKTKIQKIYIDAIEQDNYSFFKNQEFYQQVFVGSYAEFLGFDKGEILEKLYDLMNNASNDIESDLANIEVLDNKDINLDDTKPVETVSEATLNEEFESSKDEMTLEIESLIVDVNSKIDDDVSDYFHEDVETTSSDNKEAVVANDLETDKLNSSIFEEIEKINTDVVEKKDVLDEIKADTLPEIQSKPENISPLESTAVIDLTSGIELEQINKISTESNSENSFAAIDELFKDEVVVEEPSIANIEDAKARLENTGIHSLKEIEKSINRAKDNNIINDDPEKTAMDLKIAKALGDSKVVLDAETNKKIKKDKAINIALIIVILVLILFLLYYFITAILK